MWYWPFAGYTIAHVSLLELFFQNSQLVNYLIGAKFTMKQTVFSCKELHMHYIKGKFMDLLHEIDGYRRYCLPKYIEIQPSFQNDLIFFSRISLSNSGSSLSTGSIFTLSIDGSTCLRRGVFVLQTVDWELLLSVSTVALIISSRTSVLTVITSYSDVSFIFLKHLKGSRAGLFSINLSFLGRLTTSSNFAT